MKTRVVKAAPQVGHLVLQALAAAFLLLTALAQATPTKLGDLDDDGVFTANDLAMLVGHSSGTAPLASALQPFADLTLDGAINDADHGALVNLILETRTPENLPLSTVRFTSPASGEGDVSVNRETIVHFTVPLALNASLDTTKFYAEFGGRKILSRAQISADRKKATLFYLEPLPANSRVKVTLDGSALNDLLGRPFDANGNGWEASALESRSEEVYRMSFDTHTSSPVPFTGITGRVVRAAPEGSATVPPSFANTGVPGVTITVDGMEQSLRTTTDAQGYFTLSPCPSGVFFVHIDGRTSPWSRYPSGSYYPNVGKKWEAIAGKADNLSGSSEDSLRGIVYLPCICPGTLKPVSQTQETTLTFPPAALTANPQLAGTTFTFPANTVFSDDGTRGGSLGPAPVPADRLPSPLPPGLRLPFVFSLQTSGPTNFERPVAVCLPNLPDPLTGYKPVPGEKTALVAFNHDTGQWEVVGPMTVTADGNFMKSDPGVGLRQPGWGGGTPGGTAPGVQGSFDPPTRLPCDNPSLLAAPGLQGVKDFFGFLGNAAGMTGGITGGVALGAIGSINDAYNAISNPSSGNITEAANSIAEGLSDNQSPLGRTLGAAGVGMDLLGAKESVEEFGEKYNKQLGEIGEDCFGYSRYFPPKSPTPAEQMKAAADQKWNNAFNQQAPLIEGLQQVLPDLNVTSEKIRRNPRTNPRAILSEQEWDKFLEGVKIVSDNLKAIYQNPLLPEVGLETVDAFVKVGSHITLVINRGDPSFVIPTSRIYWKITSAVSVDRFVTEPGSPWPTRILAPRSVFEVSAYSASTELIGFDAFVSPNAGGAFRIPTFRLQKDKFIDSDGDGLSDLAEGIVGTSSSIADSDGDGITDGAELKNGSNPLSELASFSGVIARASFDNLNSQISCTDITAGRDVLAAACGTEGVYILGVRQGLTPTRLAQITTTPNAANVVTISLNMLAIGLGSTGTMIVDISTPDAPQFLRLIKIGSSVRSLAAAEGIVHIGLEDGRVAQVDMITGRLIGSVNVGAPPHDLAIGKGVLYAVVPGSLKTLPVTNSGYGSVGTTGFSGTVPNTTNRFRLFKDSNRLYAAHRTGFSAYNITTATAPALLQDNTTAALGWSHLVATGSNIAIATLGANNPDDVSLYDLGADGAQANFLTTFATPGAAQAATIYNGLAYVADGTEGVQVVNFRAFDTLGQPPAVTLALEAPSTTAEEGRFLPVIANATDDVQVRNVEFLVDGESLDTDGNFPFEARVLTPRLAPGKTSFTVQARATDTGGNSALSNVITLDLTADTQSPSVLTFTPGNDALLTTVSGFTALFTEPVIASSLNASSVYLWAAGTDGNVGTDDDVRVPVTLLPAMDGSGTFRDTASFQAASPLPPDRYRVLLTLGITDANGNRLAAPHSSTFQVISGTDSDGDGIVDNLEVALGLDPENQDSNGNGIPDGSEDYDGDGLRNAWELRYGFDPRLVDTNGNGTNDNLEDGDKDTLNALAEQTAGSDPTKADTDGDSWPDQVEVEFASNAADARSKPLSLFVGSPAVTTAIIGGGMTVATPPTTVTLFGGGTTIATPPTTIRTGTAPP